MKKSIVVILSLLLAANLFAQEQVSHKEVATVGMIPYVDTVVTLGTYGFLPSNLHAPYLAGMSLLGNIPAYQVYPDSALWETGFEASTIGAGFILSHYPVISEPLFNIGWKATWWTQYEAYSKLRNSCDFYTDTEQVSLSQAFTAPFNPQILKRNEVWIPLLAGTALAVASEWGNTENAVWKTGRTYLGDTQVPVVIGIGATTLLTGASMLFTAAGEEALFRGIGYQEMKSSYGQIPATVVDALLFSAVHIPQELIDGTESATILGNFAARAGIACLLEWIYNQGGLQSSIAFHMWYNTINTMTQYVCTGGQQVNATTAHIGGNTAMNVGYTPDGIRLNFSVTY